VADAEFEPLKYPIQETLKRKGTVECNIKERFNHDIWALEWSVCSHTPGHLGFSVIGGESWYLPRYPLKLCRWSNT